MNSLECLDFNGLFILLFSKCLPICTPGSSVTTFCECDYLNILSLVLSTIIVKILVKLILKG